jgi:hypothetical protein
MAAARSTKLCELTGSKLAAEALRPSSRSDKKGSYERCGRSPRCSAKALYPREIKKVPTFAARTRRETPATLPIARNYNYNESASTPGNNHLCGPSPPRFRFWSCGRVPSLKPTGRPLHKPRSHLYMSSSS